MTKRKTKPPKEDYTRTPLVVTPDGAPATGPYNSETMNKAWRLGFGYGVRRGGL